MQVLSQVVGRLGVVPASRLVTARPDGVIPVPSPLVELFTDGGLRRGSLLSVPALSLVAALMASATRSGAWCAVVAVSELSPAAAARQGVALERCVFASAMASSMPAAIGALMEGVDMVVVGDPAQLSSLVVRQVMARARTSGTVLLGTGRWPGADMAIRVEGSSWSGTHAGYGRLRSRRMQVAATGRRIPVPRRVDVEWTPDGLA